MVEILHVLVNLQNDFLQTIGTTNKCTVKGANYQEKYQTPPIPNSLYPKLNDYADCKNNDRTPHRPIVTMLMNYCFNA